MLDTHYSLTSLFGDIADAIRAKTGSEAEIVADNFPAAIGTIPTGEPTEYTSATGLTLDRSSKSSGSGTYSVDYTVPKSENAGLYAVIYSAFYGTAWCASQFIVFKPDGTYIGKNGNFTITENTEDYTVTVSQTVSSGQTVRYSFFGFVLS